MVGISLSFCVQDICRGVVNLNDVKMLYTGTAFKSAEDAIQHYSKTYWRNLPKAARICRKLWDEGKIVQSRLLPSASDYSICPVPVIYHGTPWYPDEFALIAGQLEDGNQSWVNLVFSK